ncbi:Response regulator receiver protein [Desulfosarcina cetonica]|uniref:response regulator n=1 Tax=Desulfosarcina cetonica TaxID=90730 RepID=UPI0006D212C6|nr:response regulator [Desulfosarcina cetonica]VTR67216.1 Response regulator receiver protein [Desulfosarcina cetonica]
MAKILVIDDDDTVRLSLRLALEDADHDVDVAADGEEGILRMRANPADLVVTDIFMPEKEGLETIDEIRRAFPATKIIAISGGGRMDPNAYLEISQSVGADRALNKPFDIKLLLDTVRELLQAG